MCFVTTTATGHDKANVAYTGTSFRKGNARRPDFQQHESQYQRAKGSCSFATILNIQGANWSQIFKIVLSKAFDLKCTIPEIENVGEPLLLYQNC